MDTTHDTSFTHPHDRTNLTYPSSVTDWGIRRQYNMSIGDPTHSVISVPPSRIVEIDSTPQMFPSHPKFSLVTSIVFTFICCFVCSVPAIIASKQAVDRAREGDKRLAASLANKIAFWLALSFTFGLICWASLLIFTFGYRFFTLADRGPPH